MNRTTRSNLLGAATMFLLAAGPATASADSIAYVKGGSIWLSTGDGARQYQVTDGGGYSTVSQADDGRMVALHGDSIAYLDRQGNVLADITTPVSTTTDPSMQFKGPFDPVISPDGRRVAYTYYWQYTGYDPYCNPSTYCYVKRLYQGIAFTAPDRLTAWDEPGMRRQSGWIHPFWIGNDAVFASDPAILPNEDLVMVDPSKDKTTGFTRWFSHAGAGIWGDADMTRSQRKLAGVAGDSDERILFAYADGLPVNGGDPHYPTQCPYQLTDPEGGAFKQVSWAPDGRALAYEDGAGINTVAIPEFGATFGDCGSPSEQPRLLLAGATSPSWGPADVPPARVFPPVKASPTPAPTPTPVASSGGVPSPVTSPGIVLGAPTGGAKLTIGRALAKGLPVTVQVPGPGTLTVSAKARGKVVATGKARPGAAGGATVKLTFSKAAKRSLAATKSLTLSITATHTPKSGKKTTQRSKITITR